MGNKGKKNRKSQPIQKRRKSTITPNMKLDARFSALALTVQFGGNDIRLQGDESYQVQIDDENFEVREIPQDIFNQLAKAIGMYRYGSGLYRTPQDIKATYPKKLKYLNKNNRQELKENGILTKHSKTPLLENLKIREFGLFFECKNPCH